MNIKQFCLAFGVLVTLACAPAAVLAGQDDAASYDAALKAAQAAQEKAATVGGEWRDIGKMLKQSQEAAKKGDHTKAVKLANQAREQGELGYEQAMEQKNVGFPSYMN